MNLFTENVIPGSWDGEIEISSIKGKTDWMRLIEALPCGDGVIEVGFEYNGASVGPLRFAFPKWKHPISTARHDKRCNVAQTYKKSNRAEYKRLRKIADDMFKVDVGVGGTWLEQQVGYIGVRLGSIF